MNAGPLDHVINIDACAIRELDLSPLQAWMEQPLPERLRAGAVVELRTRGPGMPMIPAN